MTYDSTFFEHYEKYLYEPAVRQQHDVAFRAFHTPIPHHGIVDLGCGSGEYRRFGSGCRAPNYLGIDAFRSPYFPCGVTHLVADYMNMHVYETLAFAPDRFVSLFSVEACYPVDRRYELYRQLFRNLPSLRDAVVAGFYYASKRNNERVGETGDIISYQTIEDTYDVVCDEFDEVRLLLRTPSVMFGDDVVEVWKHLIRR